MERFVVLLFGCVLMVLQVPLTAAAEDNTQKNTPIQLQPSKEFCERLLARSVAATPSRDVARADVAYKGGVDVDGNPVAPADLNPLTIPLPTKIRIPITIQKQYMWQTQTMGTTSETGTLTTMGIINQTVSGVIQGTAAANQTQLNAFVAGLPNGGNTPLQNLTVTQLNTLAGIISGTSGAQTLTGTATGFTSGVGLTQSSGTFVGQGITAAMPVGTIQSPYVDNIPLGYVDFYLATGELTYNGKPVTSEEEKILQKSCQKILAEGASE